MRENRTFVLVVFFAMGLFAGHFLVGANWFFAICLAATFGGLAKGLLDNRVDDAVVNGAMVVLFAFLAKMFPSIWAWCADTFFRKGYTSDATDDRVISVLLFVALYTVLHLVVRMFVSSVMVERRLSSAAQRKVWTASMVATYFFTAFLGVFAVCWAGMRFFRMGAIHYLIVGALAIGWLALAVKRLVWRAKMCEVQAAREGTARAAGESSAVRLAVRSRTTFADVAGMDDAKRQIRLRLIDPIRDRARALRYGIKPGGGILLYGPPGTGKTLLARAVAGELGIPFFTITAADIFGKLVGDSEKNVRRLFREIRRHALSVVFIDELETIFPNRTSDVHETTRKVIAFMLQELDGVEASKNPILLMGATNVPWMVDEAFLRPGRFDVKIFVGLPDCATREKIISLLFASGSVRPVPGLVEYLAQRTENYSGADLKGIVDSIRQLAYDRHVPLYTHALADEAIAQVPPSATGSILAAIKEWESKRT